MIGKTASRKRPPPSNEHRCKGRTERGVQCKRAKATGSAYCEQHDPERFPRYGYVVQRNLKPYERLPSGQYRRHVIGRVFDSRDEAWAWLHTNWRQMCQCRTPGKRFVSATVESFRLSPEQRATARARLAGTK